MCVYSSVVFVLSRVFLHCLLLDSPPPCFSSLNNTSVRCSLRTTASEEEGKTEEEKEEERDARTPRKSKRDRDGGGRQEEKKSFERLLTSKLTVIAVLARGESTFKHTG